MKKTHKNIKTKNKDIASPKGMRDLMNETYYNFQGFFEKAQEVAVYYGFKPIDTPLLEHRETFTTSIGAGTDIVDKEMYTLKTKGGDHLALRPEHTAPLVRAYIEHGMQNMPQPLMFYQYGPVFRHDNPQHGRYRQFWQFDVDALGSEKSIMDALVIKTGMTILEEAGAHNLSVDINSIGDKECRSGYMRELISYYRKHIHDLGIIDRERLKINPLRILDSKDPKTKEVNENAPDSISFLCAACKKHFKEVLEYLEEMNIEYYLAHQLGSKKDVPAVGFSMGVDRIVESKWYKKLSPRIIKKPKICFIQLGTEAKLKSLNIIEILRKAHVPITQSLSRDSLGSQLGIAEKLAIPYAIIFGVKEALENSVIVRDMSNRSQETVKLNKLLEYLKELK